MQQQQQSQQQQQKKEEDVFIPEQTKDGDYVYVDLVNKGSWRVKESFGCFIYLGIAVGSFLYVPYLVFQIVYQKNIKALYILLMALFHSVYIAGPSSIFQKVMNFAQPVKWFDRFKIVSEEIVDREKVLFSWMPHAIISFPAHFSRYDPKSPFYQSYLCGSRMAVKFPLLGSILQWNSTTGADPDNFKELMSEKKNISFVPGGFEEATITSNKDYRLWINERKGFIKYGLEFGYKVHPTFVFRETKGYYTSDVFMDFRIWLNKMKLPGTVAFSKTMLLPDPDIEVTIVIGKSIKLPKIENPSKQEVDYYHKIYLREVTRLFDRYAPQYDPEAKLYLWGSQEQPGPKL